MSMVRSTMRFFSLMSLALLVFIATMLARFSGGEDGKSPGRVGLFSPSIARADAPYGNSSGSPWLDAGAGADCGTDGGDGDGSGSAC